MQQPWQGPRAQELQNLEGSSSCREYKSPTTNKITTEAEEGSENMAPRSGISCYLSWEDLLSREVPGHGRENGSLFTADNASPILPGTCPTKLAQRSMVHLKTKQRSLWKLDSAKSKHYFFSPALGALLCFLKNKN